MKARYHILFGMILLGIFIFIDYTFSFINFSITKYILSHINAVTIIFGLILYYLGLILPDSDVKDGKSRIFFGTFFIFGWINRLLEYPLAILLNRKAGHRESLHTIVGIFLSSVLFSIIFFVLIFFIESLSHIGNISNLTFVFLFFCVFLGQLMHLLCDWHWKLK
jgi:hypothetical protein